MINWFLIYFLICGMYCHQAVSYLEKDNVPDKYKDDIENFKKEIFYSFGTLNVLPMLYIIALLLGWIIVPICIIESIVNRK